MPETTRHLLSYECKMAYVGYDIPEWALELAARYGIEPYQIMQALTGPGRKWPRPVRGQGDLPALMIIARIASGTPLAIVVRPLSQWDQQVIGVMPVTGELLADFEKWEEHND
ncbi:hypothetical protein [Nocardia crassostreae]|uniref:hypothetical protein n=1 Tax=Nocardia crassostreae TaxID=53428 RepID=UPI0012FC693B|nr:hypothetical protein [Nocardia crassostreae]